MELLKVFPCAANSKKPLRGEHWRETATDDQSQISAWKRQGLNLGLPTGPINGIVIRDFDGEEGLSLARTEFQQKQFREFYRVCVRTPHGLHQYLKQPAFHVPNAVKVNGQPYDLRGDGGYALLAGSRVGTTYEYVKGFEFRSVDELPEFLPEWLPKPKEISHEVIEESDVLRRITRARLWLSSVDPAVSGQNGHKTMFRACCKMFQMFGLSMSEAFALIIEFNERAEPPFSEKELTHKLEDAYRISQGT